MHQSEPMTLKSKKGTKVMARQAKLMDAPVTRFDGREDQVSATRRTLKQMNEAADRAIDDQVARSTPMSPKNSR
jgi:hypothetical protein